MMTLEEVWENLRQDPEIKATMEEAEKSYKLFKKIENLIVSDLETKLDASKKAIVKLSNTCDEWADKYLKLEAKLAESKKEKEYYQDLYFTSVKGQEKLKQQLAEKDQAIEGLQEINQSLGQTCNNDAKEIERLREQLAEKDELYRTCCEQCERIKDKLGIITSYNQDLQNEILDKHKTNEKLKKSQNQTAIDELEKVISYLSDRTDVINDELKNFDRDEISVRFAVQKRLITDIFYVIDQQIKSLKGDSQ